MQLYANWSNKIIIRKIAGMFFVRTCRKSCLYEQEEQCSGKKERNYTDLRDSNTQLY